MNNPGKAPALLVLPSGAELLNLRHYEHFGAEYYFCEELANPL